MPRRLGIGRMLSAKHMGVCRTSGRGSVDSIPIYQHSYLGYGILAVRAKMFEEPGG